MDKVTIEPAGIRQFDQSLPSDIGQVMDAMDTEVQYKTTIILWLVTP